MTIIDPEARDERIRGLAALSLNGLKLVLVRLHPVAAPVEARLELHLYNGVARDDLVAAFAADPGVATTLFPILGGHSLPAGSAVGQVQVTDIATDPDPEVLRLTVTPIGDYSTYRLTVEHPAFDPLLSELPFKFRPGCFSIDCAPDWTPAAAPGETPVIDYLAKDFDSFRHVMVSAMAQRVPDWQVTSAADFDQTLLELFSAAADEISDFQDRVMAEATLGTARKRVSLARHARLVDYHLHQGNQATTWLAVEAVNPADGMLPAGLVAWTGLEEPDASSQVFVGAAAARIHHLLSRMALYDWSAAVTGLEAGSTEADLVLSDSTAAAALEVQELIRDGEITQLLIQEWLNPATGREAGRDPRKRQLLRLLPGDEGAERRQDPVTSDFTVHVRWREEDALEQAYCFLIDTPDGQVQGGAAFHGNLVEVSHGLPLETDFQEPGTPLASEDQEHYERPADEGSTGGSMRRGVICRLPEGPLAYRDTPPGGEIAPRSTLAVRVEQSDGSSDDWDEQISLVHSDDSDENGDHFMVETDEEGLSLLRFGNGVNGKRLPAGAIVHCRYQVGLGLDGNVGADAIVNLDQSFDPLLDQATVWNPFDVTGGRAPEPPAEAIRNAPEAFRARQLRAVTLEDYVRRAEELPEVSRAAARYAWTGSWRTVRITIDPVGSVELDEELIAQLHRHLDAVRLIGEDLEIRPPRFVPLDIKVALCLRPDVWRDDLAFVLEQEFSTGYTPDGRRGFFHPDDWTFGQALHASQIAGRVQAVPGVDHIKSIAMRRFNGGTAGGASVIEAAANEILLVETDPDHMERGFIEFELDGGRQ